MPTAAKLSAALALAAVGYAASVLLRQTMPEARATEWFAEANAAIGALVGWRFVGPLAPGTARGPAVGLGVGGAGLVAAIAVAGHAMAEMLDRSTGLRYGSLMEGLEAALALMAVYARAVATPGPLAILIGGGALAGLLARWCAARWS